MKKKDLLETFIEQVEKKELLTSFLRSIFNYDAFYDYNYIFRLQARRRETIIDIYDNISDNRFNRYIFHFRKGNYLIDIQEEKNVFVTNINVLNAYDSDNKIIKLAYLFKIRKSQMIDYARTFLPEEIVQVLKEIILNKNNSK